MKTYTLVLLLALLALASSSPAQVSGFVGVGLEPALDNGAPFSSSAVVGVNVYHSTAVTGRFGYSDSHGIARAFLGGVATTLTDFDGACDCSMSGDIQFGRVRSKGKWRTLGNFGVGFPFDLGKGVTFAPGLHVNYGGGGTPFVSLYASLSKSFKLGKR